MANANKEEPRIERAKLIPLEKNEKGSTSGTASGTSETENGKGVPVQFNPKKLRLRHRNQTSGAKRSSSGKKNGNGEKSGSGKSSDVSKQYVGRGTTTLTVDLLFDTTRETGEAGERGTSGPAGSGTKNVREKTQEIRNFMSGNSEDQENSESVPPTVKFSWGKFQFNGIIDSVDETLEFFDEDGHPLRATVSITMTRERLSQPTGDDQNGSSAGGGDGSGQDPEDRPSGAGNATGTPLQKLAGEAGKQGSWKDIARANDIENPRSIFNPSAVNMNASASAGASASAAGSASAEL